MSLDNIKLPVFLYKKLFRNSLVQTKPLKNSNKLNDEIQIDFLGSNAKKIIFLVRDDHNKFLGDAQMKFLNGLLIACNLDMNDIAIVNIFQNNSISYKDINIQLQPDKFLIFGVTSSALGLPFEIPFFQIQNFNQQQYMLAPSLEELQANVESKKQLWIGLQKIFNIQKQK